MTRRYAKRLPPGSEFVETLMARTDRTPGGCWNWTAAIDPVSGYGRISVEGSTGYAHRVAFEILVGPIPDGLTIDHLCRNRRCVNPVHLEPVTQRENTLRGTGLSARRAAQTHCQNGHSFDEANTYWFDGHRTCRVCKREYMSDYHPAWRARRAAA